MSNVSDNPRTIWTFIYIFVITITWESSVATLENKLLLVFNEMQNLEPMTSNRHHNKLLITKRSELKPDGVVLQPSQNNRVKQQSKIRNINQLVVNLLGNSTLQRMNESRTSSGEDGHFSSSNLENPDSDFLNININNNLLMNKVNESSEQTPPSDTFVDTVLIPDKNRIHKQDVGNVESYWILSWMEDSYTMSIVTPVAAGVVGGFLVLGTILVCSYIYRSCHSRKNKIRKKTLKGPVRSLRPADRIMLLAETSDDEF
ncbi:uncharacterized protein LOC111083264 [Limulus polyphemus]|uniref:Uncharacterized protein LOC111083264 n=1 Tax=Limulus polyphemus TaxID=6850 RepID=A0ABM1RVE3_LIMPO|nr:uncharacterized protein LOC111083264 [Limulus polyphemus]